MAAGTPGTCLTDHVTIQRQQLQRLNPMLRTIADRNPFYREKLGEAIGSLPLRELDQMTQLPFTSKSELMIDQAEHPPFGSNLTFPIEEYTHLHQTSGTTGQPLRVLDDRASWDWWGACWADVYRSAGISSADRIYLAFSFGPFIGFWAAYHGAEAIGAMPIPGGGQSSEQRLEAILASQSTILVSTPTYALHLASVADRLGIDLASSSVRATVHAGEPGASIPNVRDRIEKAWGAECYDHAGLSEVGAHSFSCRRRDGIHLNEHEFVFEVLDPVTCDPAPRGELVVTNLGRIGMPIIRYRTGDIVELADGPCPCGNPYQFVPGGIVGRVDSMIVVRGVNVFPSAIESVVREFPQAGEYQIVLYKDRDMDAVRLVIEASEDIARKVADSLHRQLQLRIDVEAAPYQSLPRFELKAQRVRDDREAEPTGR